MSNHAIIKAREHCMSLSQGKGGAPPRDESGANAQSERAEAKALSETVRSASSLRRRL